MTNIDEFLAQLQKGLDDYLEVLKAEKQAELNAEFFEGLRAVEAKVRASTQAAVVSYHDSIALANTRVSDIARQSGIERAQRLLQHNFDTNTEIVKQYKRECWQILSR